MDKRELNQNGLADETVRDESPVSLPDETPKIQKKRRPKKRPHSLRTAVCRRVMLLIRESP